MAITTFDSPNGTAASGAAAAGIMVVPTQDLIMEADEVNLFISSTGAVSGTVYHMAFGKNWKSHELESDGSTYAAVLKEFTISTFPAILTVTNHKKRGRPLFNIDGSGASRSIIVEIL